MDDLKNICYKWFYRVQWVIYLFLSSEKTRFAFSWLTGFSSRLAVVILTMAATTDVHVRVCEQEIIKYDLEIKALIQVRQSSGLLCINLNPKFGTEDRSLGDVGVCQSRVV